MTTGEIAAAVGVSDRQVRRIRSDLLAEGQPGGTVRTLPPPEPLVIDPFTEIARAFATQQQVEEQCRQLAASGRQEAVRLGALKTLASVSLARLDMLERIGGIPRGPSWLGELRLSAAWGALNELAAATGVDIEELNTIMVERLRQHFVFEDTNGAVEVAPLAQLLPRDRRAA